MYHIFSSLNMIISWLSSLAKIKAVSVLYLVLYLVQCSCLRNNIGTSEEEKKNPRRQTRGEKKTTSAQNTALGDRRQNIQSLQGHRQGIKRGSSTLSGRAGPCDFIFRALPKLFNSCNKYTLRTYYTGGSTT